MEQPEYRFCQWRGHPRHLARACKRKHVDACLRRLGLAAPFHTLWLGEHDVPLGLRSPKHVPESFVVASALCRYNTVLFEWNHYRRVERRLEIGLVPVDLIATIREQLLADGLPKLIRWLDGIRRLPETGITRSRALRLRYEVATGRLTAHERSAKRGSRRAP